MHVPMKVLLALFLQLITLVAAGDLDNGLYEKTLIGFQIMPNFFNGIFLVGGFTGGNESRCSGSVANNPCSIPSHHIFPKDAPTAYKKWASGDNYLDMVGAEPEQGTYKGKDAYGTPMWSIDEETAQSLLHISKSKQRLDYWVVELELDCSKTDGFFEVEAVVQTKSDRYIYETRDEIIRPGQPPIKIKQTKPPKTMIFPLDDDDDDDHGPQDDLSGHSHKRDKPRTSRRKEGVEVTPVRHGQGGHFARGCKGSAKFDFPYQTSRHLGLCGKANIFRYKSAFCETNDM